MRMPLIVGVTGGIATGKSTVTEVIAKNGFQVIDADEVNRDILAHEGNQVTVAGILKKSHPELMKVIPMPETFRTELAKIVFSDPIKLALVKEFLDPLIRLQVRRYLLKALNQPSAEIIFYSHPLLFANSEWKLCQHIWMTDLDQDAQIERLLRRMGLEPVGENLVKVMERIQLQESNNSPKEYERAALTKITDLINTRGSRSDIEARVLEGLILLKTGRRLHGPAEA